MSLAARLPQTSTGRCLFLLAVPLLLASPCAILAGLRHHRESVELDALRDEAFDALEAEHYAEAVAHLERYLEGRPDDPDALRAFAAARQEVVLPRRRHLVEAALALRRYLDARPGDVEVRREALELYGELGLHGEALAAAEAVLAESPGDPDALYAKARALSGLELANEALSAARRHAERRPDHVAGQLLLLSALRGAGREAEARRHVEGLCEAHPDAPRFALLRALALRTFGDPGEALEVARALAEVHVTALEAPSVRRLSRLLDGLGEHEEALDVLRKGAGHRPELLPDLARRLLALARWEALVDLLSTHPPGEDAELLGLQAIALGKVDRADEAGAALARLDASDTLLASIWSTIVRGFGSAGVEPSKLEAVCLDALSVEPGHAVYLFLYAEAAARRGKHDVAVEAWDHAAQAEPSWGLPRLRSARELLTRGRVALALREAEAAAQRMPRSLAAAVTLARARFAALESGLPIPAPELLDLVRRIRHAAPQAEGVSTAYVSLLARLEGVDLAREALRELLAGERAPSSPVLLELAAVSRAHGLGLARACLDRAEQAHGLTPALALRRALLIADAEDAPAARAAFDDMAAQAVSNSGATAETPVGWRVARAQLLERSGAPEAVRVWAELVEDQPDDERIQRLALESDAFWERYALVRRLLDRFRERVGEDNPLWQESQARYLLEVEGTDEAIGEARRLLARAIEAAPGQLRPRLLAARAAQRGGDGDAALQHLAAALNRRPEALWIALRLAETASELGRTAPAVEALQHVLRSGSAADEELRAAAGMLAALGRTADAVRALERLHDGRDAPADLLLARLCWVQGDGERVRRICAKLLEEPTLEKIAFTADFYAATDERARANEALALLDRLPDADPTACRLVRARFAGRHLGPEAADTHFEAAARGAPETPGPWKEWIAHCWRHGRHERAAQLLAEASVAVPDDEGLGAFATRSARLEAPIRRFPLAQSVAESGLFDARRRPAALAALEALAAASADAESPDEVASGAGLEVVRIARSEPGFLALQLLTAQLRLERGEVESAYGLATGLVERFPSSPRAAWLAAEAAARAGQWDEAILLAEEWRRRAVNDPLRLGLLVAEAHLRLGRPDAALRETEARLARAREREERPRPLYVAHARALLGVGRSEDAFALLAPLLEEGEPWRADWLRLASLALPAGPERARWLERLEEATPARAVAERVALGRGWYRLGLAAGDEDARKHARALLANLVEGDAATAQAVLAYAMVLGREGDAEAAEAAYREALRLDPDSILAKNNLAMLLAERDERLGEALTLARAAAEADPEQPAVLDTLAHVLLRRSEPDAAVDALRRTVQLDPDTVERRARLAEALVAAGATDEALAVVDDALLRWHPSMLSDPLRKRFEDVRASAAAGSDADETP